MYTPSHFDETRPDVLHALVRAHPLGLLVTHGAAGLSANPVPFLFDPARGPHGTLRCHVARANPVWRESGSDVLVVFQGPEAYVSPNWYPSKAESGKVVPTWNYVVVQGRGRMQAHEDAGFLRPLLADLTAEHEAAQPRPWTMDDAPAAYVDALLKAIVGLEVTLDAPLAGKWKVSQNRPAADRDGVASGLSALGAAGAAAMAAQVRQPGTPSGETR